MSFNEVAKLQLVLFALSLKPKPFKLLYARWLMVMQQVPARVTDAKINTCPKTSCTGYKCTTQNRVQHDNLQHRVLLDNMVNSTGEIELWI